MLMFLKMIWTEYFVFEARTIHSVELQHYCFFGTAITEIALDPSVCEMEQCFWPNCCEFKIRPIKNLCNYASCFSQIQLESCYHKLCCCTSFLSMEIHLFSKMVGFLSYRFLLRHISHYFWYDVFLSDPGINGDHEFTNRTGQITADTCCSAGNIF